MHNSYLGINSFKEMKKQIQCKHLYNLFQPLQSIITKNEIFEKIPWNFFSKIIQQNFRGMGWGGGNRRNFFLRGPRKFSLLPVAFYIYDSWFILNLFAIGIWYRSIEVNSIGYWDIELFCTFIYYTSTPAEPRINFI